MGSHRGALVTVLCLFGLLAVCNAVMSENFETWQPHAVSYWANGRGLTLSLFKNESAAGAGTKDTWMFGHFGAWIKLPGGNAAGTVATFYLTSPHPGQCEFDLELLGHNEGKPRKIHTNVFVDGEGGMEQQILFPDGIDPTSAYHYYSFEWHSDMVVFYIDWKPIRMFKNLQESNGIKYCNHKPMGVFLSIWDGDSWATEGGSVKLDWSQAPFECKYSDILIDGCKAATGDTAAVAACQSHPAAKGPGVTPAQIEYMKGIRYNESLVKYNYCADYARYPEGSRPDCIANAM